MMSLARIHVWWPNIDRELEVVCLNVSNGRRIPEIQPVHPWEQPGAPWKQLHIDFAGPFCGAMWLIVVDTETKWPKVVQMESTN